MALLPFQRRIAINWSDFLDPKSSASAARTHFPLDAAAAQRPFQPVKARASFLAEHCLVYSKNSWKFAKSPKTGARVEKTIVLAFLKHVFLNMRSTSLIFIELG